LSATLNFVNVGAPNSEGRIEQGVCAMKKVPKKAPKKKGK